MSQLSIEEKIQLLDLTKSLVLGNGGGTAESPKPSEFRAMYCMLRDLALEGTNVKTSDSMSYLVTDHGDGTAGLTVFKKDTAAGMNLDREILARLIIDLAGCLSPTGSPDAASDLRIFLAPMFQNEADADLLCNLANVLSNRAL